MFADLECELIIGLFATVYSRSKVSIIGNFSDGIVLE